jgi:polyisoprenoid-binding protein YceI
LRWWIVGGAATVVVLAVGGPFVYIHLIEGPAPAKLSLPAAGQATTAPSRTASPQRVAQASPAGVWHVAAGSVAGYRVQEVLIGQSSTAVGRTAEISGSLTIKGSTLESGSFTVDMASVTSDQSERNAQFDGRIMDVSQYPTATLTLTGPVDLGSVSPDGAIHRYRAEGRLTMHGVTASVIFPVEADWTAGSIEVLADVPITFSRWDIANPSVGGFVTTASTGTLEVLLHLTLGSGNRTVTAASSQVTGATPGGPPGQVTVPSTTTPPLTIPTAQG